MTAPVLTAGHWARNADMVADVLSIHANPGANILDVTYGKGNFWRPDTLERYTVISNDAHVPGATFHFDYRALPDSWNDIFDVVVFDPPYVVKGTRVGHGMDAMNNAYGLIDAPKTVAELATANAAGLAECARGTRPGGLVLVKSADAVSGGKKHAQIDGMNDAARALGLTKTDRFIFYTKTARPQPARTRKDGTTSRQHHGHNNTSELLVYRKP